MATEKPTTDDYEPSDGIDSGALDQCPHCETSFSPNGGYSGTIYDKYGNRYDHITETDVTDRPFFCKPCYNELETNRKQSENQSITEWVDQ